MPPPPPLYVLNFTSNPPSLSVIFSYAPHTNFPTPTPGNYCTVPKVPRRRQRAKRRFLVKSRFAFFQTFSRLLQVAYFVKQESPKGDFQLGCKGAIFSERRGWLYRRRLLQTLVADHCMRQNLM